MKKSGRDTQSMTSSHHCFGIRLAEHTSESTTGLNLAKSTTSLFVTDESNLQTQRREKQADVGIQREETKTDTKRCTIGGYGSDKSMATQTKPAETKNKSFLNFLRRGFSARNRNRTKNITTSESSAFEAPPAVSTMHSEFSKYIALEKTPLDSCLPYSVEESLRPPLHRELSVTQKDVDESSTAACCRSESDKSDANQTRCYRHSTQRPPRPSNNTPKSTQQMNSIVPNNAAPDSSNTKYPRRSCPSQNSTQAEVFVRRPRTPTLGRTALLVRASYSNLDREAKQLDTFSEKRTQHNSHGSWTRFNDIHMPSRGMSRSSSVNCELKEQTNLNTGNLDCSTSTLTNSPKGISGDRPLHEPINPRPIAQVEPSQHINPSRCRWVQMQRHTYDSVPLEHLKDCVKPTGFGLSMETRQIVSPKGDLKNVSKAPVCSEHLESLWGRPKSVIHYSTCTEQTENKRAQKTQRRSDQTWTTVPQNNSAFFGNSIQSNSHQRKPEFSMIVRNKVVAQSQTEDAKLPHPRRSKLPIPCDRNPKPLTKNVLSTGERSKLTEGHHLKMLTSKEISESKKDSSVRDVSPYTDKNAAKSITDCQTPVDLVKRESTKSSLNHHKADAHQVTRHRQSAMVPVQTSVSAQNGQLSGSIGLRKRAKPELENARYRDISLKLSVQEVKNLTPKGRYFCEICLDRTLYARTTSKQSDGTVFWGERFELNNLPEISIITINLYRQGSVLVKDKKQRGKGQNQFIAFVTIPISDLSQSSEQQKWLPMRSPYDTLHIVDSNNWQELGCGGNANEPRRLNSVTGSPGGARSRKRSMPVTCFRPTPSNTDYHETETKSTTEKLKSSGKKKRSWVAGLSTTAEGFAAKQTETSIAKCSSASNSPTYLLKNNVFSLTQSPVPQLRLNILYEAVDVLPLDYYEDFQELLRSHTIDILRFLEPKLSAKQKEELASCIVNIHEKVSNLSVADLLADLVRLEIAENANQSMLLRANSMASKAIECYIKLVGTEYLHRILKGPIDQLLASAEDFEVDPHRIKLPDSAGITVNSQIERNQAALLNHLSTIWNRILENTRRIPYELREIFTTLRCLFEQTLGPQIAIQLISSCLFLRFICPAIHGPVLFGLTPSIPESARVSRNLTLLAKVLQNLANMVPFEEKEIHMKIFNPFMEKEIPVMREFLESISSADLDDDESSYSDCHHYIDLGYEFAKLSSVLSRYVKEEVVPDELSRLPDILKFIHEHTNDTVLSSWTPDMVSCRRFTNCVDAPSQEQPLSEFRRRFTSTDSILTNPHLSNFEAKEFLQSGSVQLFNPESSNIPAGDTESMLFTNEPSVSPSPHSTNDAMSTDAIQQYSEIQNTNSSLYTWPEVVDSLAEQSGSKVETMEQLISQYKEQLRQLNACIEQVENISLTTKPVNVKKIFQREGFALPSSLDTAPETRACIGVKNGNRDHAFPWSPINRCGQDDVTLNNEGSDYEYGDDEKEAGHGHCRSEPVRFCSSDRGVERQKVLAESPSLDQLSDRLQELKHLLKHERHELAQVVAEKTMAIKEQEQSIEKMVSELDQLRRHPTPGVGPLHPVNSSARLSTPGTISPSSSFSSGCFASTQSDDLSSNPNERRPSESNAFWYQKSECSVRKHHIQYAGNKLRSQSFHSHSSSNRIKLNGGSEVLAPTQMGPNLLDLSRASEGTGIPLGDLIISKHTIPVKRRTSEAKLMRN